MLKYLREEIKNFPTYEVVEKNFPIKLDANEGIERIDGLNRYPVDRADELRGKLAKKIGKEAQELLLGNGSSELIELVMKAYLEAGERVVSFSPTFTMYRNFTIIHKGVYEDYPLEGMDKLNIDGFIDFIKEKKAKIVLVCNPNNPTGSLIPKEDILKIISSVDAMVILDEAYIEFADYPEGDDTRDFKNLIVLRTFSKAMGLAGIRLGYMIGHEEIIGYINRVRSPYNINILTQEVGLRAIEDDSITRNNIEMIKKERQRMIVALEEKKIKAFSSEGNFLFFPAERYIIDYLSKKGILIRDYGGELEGYYRLTIGTPEENNIVLKAIEEGQNERS